MKSSDRINARLIISRLLLFIFNSDLVGPFLLMMIWQVKQARLVKNASFALLVLQIHQESVNVLHYLVVCVVVWYRFRSLLSMR